MSRRTYIVTDPTTGLCWDGKTFSADRNHTIMMNHDEAMSMAIHRFGKEAADSAVSEATASEYMKFIGRIGGSRITTRKKIQSKLNGMKGGRPRE